MSELIGQNWGSFIILALAFLLLLFIFDLIINNKYVVFGVQIATLVLALLWYRRDLDYEPLIAVLSAIGVLQTSKVFAREKSAPSRAKIIEERKTIEDVLDRELDIAVWKAHKQEILHRVFLDDAPLEQWVIVFTVENHGKANFYFERVQIIFTFREAKLTLVKEILHYCFKYDSSIRIALYLDKPEPSASQDGFLFRKEIPALLNKHENIRLFNWETGTTIKITPYSPVPSPKTKELWCLYGEFPVKLAEQLREHGLYLYSMKVIFHTDKGQFKVSSFFETGEMIPKELQQTLR